MILGRVVGEVWAARRHAGLHGQKLLLVEPHYWYGPPFEVAHVVAVDQLGAGIGDDVVVCLGEPARQSISGFPASGGGVPGYAKSAMFPVEAAVLAVVDRVFVDADAGTFRGQALSTVLSSAFAETLVSVGGPGSQEASS
jgi:ethanolamine utilization protein EutN